MERVCLNAKARLNSWNSNGFVDADLLHTEHMHDDVIK